MNKRQRIVVSIIVEDGLCDKIRNKQHGHQDRILRNTFYNILPGSCMGVAFCLTDSPQRVPLHLENENKRFRSFKSIENIHKNDDEFQIPGSPQLFK